MGINIQAKQDVSYLFSNLNNNNTTTGLLSGNWLSDYASIKNGTYGKLMKAYFSTDAGKEISELAKSKDALATTEDSKSYAKAQTTSDALKESADALLETGEESLFAMKEITTKDENGVETTTQGYDVEGIYKAVNGLVNNYNAVLNAAADTGNKTIENRALALVNDSITNLKPLKAIGITMDEDGIMTLDKETFEKADMSAVKKLFNGVGSYGYNISAGASLLNFAAQNAANTTKAYTAAGQYSTDFSSGNLFASWF